MDKISYETVEKMSALSKLRFTEDEKKKIALELDGIVSFMEKIGSVDTMNVTNTVYSSSDDEKLRADEPLFSLTPDEIFSNVPEMKNNCIAVPKVI